MGIRQAELTRVRVVALVAMIAGGAILAAAVAVALASEAGESGLLRVPFLLMCHGQEARSFEIAGAAMPICARCTGVYSGIASAAILLLLVPPTRRHRVMGPLGLALMTPLVVDGFMQLFGLWSTGNVPRSITGLLFGAGLIIVAGNALAGTTSGHQPSVISHQA